MRKLGSAFVIAFIAAQTGAVPPLPAAARPGFSKVILRSPNDVVGEIPADLAEIVGASVVHNYPSYQLISAPIAAVEGLRRAAQARGRGWKLRMISTS